jgi:hypothetical protein
MTKADLLAGPVRWHNVADLQLAVGDDYSVEQELHQGTSLLEGRLGQTLPHPLAEIKSPMAPDSPASSLCRSA